MSVCSLLSPQDGEGSLLSARVSPFYPKDLESCEGFRLFLLRWCSPTVPAGLRQTNYWHPISPDLCDLQKSTSDPPPPHTRQNYEQKSGQNITPNASKQGKLDSFAAISLFIFSMYVAFLGASKWFTRYGIFLTRYRGNGHFEGLAMARFSLHRVAKIACCRGWRIGAHWWACLTPTAFCEEPVHTN